MGSLSVISYLGSFGGIGILRFPYDLAAIFPLSIMILCLSQILLRCENHKVVHCDIEPSPA